MNILRIWGEGVIPPPVVLRRVRPPRHLHLAGLHVRLLRPRAGDTEFLENCRAEIEGTIRRLRNHPSLLLWVGGNEQYLWVFDRRMSRRPSGRSSSGSCPKRASGWIRRGCSTPVRPTAAHDRQLAAGRRLARLHHDQFRARRLRAAVRLGGSPRQRALAYQHAAIPERGGTLAEGIRSRHPQAGPAGLAAGLVVPLDGHRHLGPRRRDRRVLRPRVRRRT